MSKTSFGQIIGPAVGPSRRLTMEAEAFAMPVDHRRRFDRHHGVEDLRPDPVKPHPEQPVGGEEPGLARALPPQDGHLMSQGDELEFQGEATTNPEREQRTEGGQKRKHADDGMTVAPETLHLQGFGSFE